eukprot:1148392-Pelagomonas_calceolata.AAC.13
MHWWPCRTQGIQTRAPFLVKCEDCEMSGKMQVVIKPTGGAEVAKNFQGYPVYPICSVAETGRNCSA